MNKILLLAVLLLSLNGFGQNKASVKGKLIDSVNRSPVEFATVAALDQRDTASNLISYTLSDKNGVFTLHNLPEGIPVKLLISFVAYQPFRKTYVFKKGEALDLGNIELKSKQLQEVTIKGERVPISMHKDTIVFDAEAFKVRPNAVVEDLLKKLPGVEVDNEGNITVMAKGVSQVLVDGRRFFPSDLRIATRNLDADLISKIEVYDDRENDPDHLIPDADVKKIINLKFKKVLKKSIFGKLYAGDGTNSHYQAGGLLNMFRDTLQVSLLGATNNLNSTGFDYNDLYSSGGIDRGGAAIQRGGFIGLAPQGTQTLTTGGVNINTDYGNKLKMNLAYLYKHTRNELNSMTNSQQFLGDTTATTGSTSYRSNIATTHSISGTVAWKPDDETQLMYTPVLNITQNGAAGNNSSNSYSNFINPINNSVNSNNSSGNSYQFQQSLSYNRQLKKKGSSFSVSHDLQITPAYNTNYDNNDLVSYISTFPSYNLRRLGDNNNKNTSANLSLNYRYPLSKKITADISTSANYNYSLNKVSTYDYDPVTGLYDSFLIEQSSDLTRNNWTENIIPGITYNIVKNVNLVAHVNAQWQQVNNIFKRSTADIDKRYFFLMPNINLNISAFSLSYNRSIQLPNIGDMIPYTVIFTPLYSVTGNPGLKPSIRDNFSIRYTKFSFQSGWGYSFNGGISLEQNSIFRQRTINTELVETSMPVNRSGRYNNNFGAFVNKRFKKRNNVQLSITTNLSFFNYHNFFVLNQQNGFQDNYNFSLSEQLSLNYKDKIIIDPQYDLTPTFTTYSGVNYANQNYVRQSASVHFNVFMPQKLNLEGNYKFTHNPLVPDGFQKNTNLLNLSLARQLLKKDRGEIKLSCYDLLNQNISSTRSVNENMIVDSQTQIIKRYFMLTLQYKFNKATTK